MISWVAILDKMSTSDLEAMETISMQLHGLEEQGIEIPRRVEAVWLRMTDKIQRHYVH